MSQNSINQEKSACESCLQPTTSLKQIYHCGLCQKLLCKNCVDFVDEDFFSFWQVVPEELKLKTYCRTCFDQKVRPAKESYTQILTQAREIHIFEKGEKFIPLIKKERYKVNIENCADRKETLLRLAFLAAEASYNSVVDVEINYKKVRSAGGYQTTNWSGVGYLAEVRPDRIVSNPISY